jgi:hypothetical protein
MRLPRRASLLVAFSLLISAATAYAECAWVLWSASSGAEGDRVWMTSTCGAGWCAPLRVALPPSPRRGR